MKKIRKHINDNKKISITISLFLILFSLLLIYLDYYNAQKIYNSIKKIDIEELEKQEDKKYLDRIKSLDLISDSSLTKFVNNTISFNDVKYLPNNLEYIKGDYVFDVKGAQQLRQEANFALEKLAKDFFQEFNLKLKIVSAYRSYEYQKGIKDRGCPDNLCAKAGYSEHQTGLAVDIFAASTQKEWQTNPDYIKYYNWFVANAYKYGFSNTYQKGLKIDGYEIEPWHWRYLGIDLAKYLLDNNITIAEFYRG